MEKGIQIALRYLENKLTRLINRGVLIKLTQSQNNYSNLHFYCSTLVFNIYFFEFAKLLGGPGPPPGPSPRYGTAYMQITVHPPDFAGDKNVDFEFPDDCLFGHPFYFGYHDFIS